MYGLSYIIIVLAAPNGVFDVHALSLYITSWAQSHVLCWRPHINWLDLYITQRYGRELPLLALARSKQSKTPVTSMSGN